MTEPAVIPGFHAVIPAGGSGTRLWPLSRSSSPKFLHDVTGTGASLLETTVARLRPLADEQHLMLVTGASHAVAAARQLPGVPEANLLVEPSPRDSAPAIGLAAAVIAQRDPDGVMGSFASDHTVADPAAFHTAIRAAAQVARAGYLVTIGMTPSRAETGFGYIEQAASLGGELAGTGARAVAAFAEKPDAATAQSYLDGGRHLWNASMFVWRASVFLAELARQAPELHAGVTEIARFWDTDARAEAMEKLWPTLPRISVDYAVMEGAAAAGTVAVVPAEFGWSDVGDWLSVQQVSQVSQVSDHAPAAGTDPGGVTVLGEPDQVLVLDSPGSVVLAGASRQVVLLDLPELVVADTPDALLVAPLSSAQRVKDVVGLLKEQGRAELT